MVVVDCVGAILLLTKEGEVTREGPTAVGGVKNEPSSSVSKKSLRNQETKSFSHFWNKTRKKRGTYVRMENSFPNISG